jgi:thymidylate synthase
MYTILYNYRTNTNIRENLKEYCKGEKEKDNTSWGKMLGYNIFNHKIPIVTTNKVELNEILSNLKDIYPNANAPSDHPPCCAKISLN